MPYQVVLAMPAQQDLGRLPPELQDYLTAKIARLAADPTRLSRPSAFPFPPGFQLFHPDPFTDAAGARHDFAVLFRYGQDETTLHVAMIGHTG